MAVTRVQVTANKAWKEAAMVWGEREDDRQQPNGHRRTLSPVFIRATGGTAMQLPEAWLSMDSHWGQTQGDRNWVLIALTGRFWEKNVTRHKTYHRDSIVRLITTVVRLWHFEHSQMDSGYDRIVSKSNHAWTVCETEPHASQRRMKTKQKSGKSTELLSHRHWPTKPILLKLLLFVKYHSLTFFF